MSEWDFGAFSEKMGRTTEYGVAVGRPMVGKTALAGYLSSSMGFKVIDMKAVADKVRAGLATEDGEFEGEVPMKDVEKAVATLITEAAGGGQRTRFLFDGFTHGKNEDFLAFVSQFGVP